MNEPTGNEKTNILLTAEEIMTYIPHRFPFLLVDRVTKITDTSISAYRNVTINDQFLQGHFPGFAIVPGVLIVEGLAQTGAVYYSKKYGFEPNSIMAFAGISKAKFRRPVRPGDRLDYEVTIDKVKGPMVMFQGKATVDGFLACEAEMMASVIKQEPK